MYIGELEGSLGRKESSDINNLLLQQRDQEIAALKIKNQENEVYIGELEKGRKDNSPCPSDSNSLLSQKDEEIAGLKKFIGVLQRQQKKIHDENDASIDYTTLLREQEEQIVSKEKIIQNYELLFTEQKQEIMFLNETIALLRKEVISLKESAIRGAYEPSDRRSIIDSNERSSGEGGISYICIYVYIYIIIHTM